jgi:hypothetical protein
MRGIGEERSSGRRVLVDRLSRRRLQKPAEQDFHVAVVARVVLLDHVAEPRVVLIVRRLPGLLVAERLVLLGHLRQPLEDGAELDRHRLLAPERPVVVEDRNPLFGRHVAGGGLYELDDRRLRRPFVPGREQVPSRSRSAAR